MNTPILKARKGSEELIFYNEGEYQEWKENTPGAASWAVKYYKGLGTSTGKEFKEYLAAKKIVFFTSTGPDSHAAIDKVFNKKLAADRKVWLAGYDAEAYLDTNQTSVSYEEFIDREMIHFSKADNDRSIPSMVDGLKTSLRKIIYTTFIRKMKKEIKVAQLSGSVSELSGYHHGEASLNKGITMLAQNFVGSNNINLLTPNGQFGTRLEGGSDAASERYIFTELSPLTRLIFPEADDKVLDYLDDDGQLVEPRFYAGVIPMLCVNGCKGIGTGFSTDIPPYNPLVLIDYIKKRLNKESVDSIDMIPYFQGFKGTVTALSSSKYLIRGCYQVISDKVIRVTELPVGYWTADFKKHLEELIEPDVKKEKEKEKETKTKSKTKNKGDVRDYIDSCTERIIDFTIEFAPGVLNTLIGTEVDYGCNALEKLLKLYTTKTTTNMHAFDEKDRLRLFNTPQEIIDAYMPVRHKVYQDRKNHQVKELTYTAMVLSNKARFIQSLTAEPPEIELRKKTKSDIVNILTGFEYDMVDNNYNYLIRMPLDSQTIEEAEKLLAQRDQTLKSLEVLKETQIETMWLDELSALHEKYSLHMQKRAVDENDQNDKGDKQASAKKIKIKRRLKKV